MLFAIKLTFLFFLSPFIPAQAEEKGPLKEATSRAWLSYLQYTAENSKQSLITSSKFFFHPEGHLRPDLELRKSVEALNSQLQVPSESGPMPVQCAFPARLRLLEKLTGRKFPSHNCAELERWKQQLGGQKIWIVYAGAYRNNPASLFGHTFLRFDKSQENDPSRTLRSQSVGFLADTPPGEGQTETVFKGLLGFYNGFYNIQPYYMQTALYNNSESRSLWEFELNLTEEEKQWAVLYLWELSERGSAPYWFFDENCSFQLMAFLEAVRPQSKLTQKTGIFVLPLDTVRILQNENMLYSDTPMYQASIRTRLQERLHRMTSEQRKTYRQARKDLSVLATVQDVEILDALTEYQTFFNYQKQAQLNPEQRVLFEKTFIQRAQLQKPSPEIELTREPVSPIRSHPSSFWQLGGSLKRVHFESLMGAHDWSSSLEGVEDVSAIEYMGFEGKWNTEKSELEELDFRVARARTLNDWSWEEPQWSWTVDGSYQEFRELGKWVRGISTGGAGGIAWTNWNRSWAGGIFLQSRLQPQAFLKSYEIGWGPMALLRYENDQGVFAAESSLLYWGSERQYENRAQYLFKIRKASNLRPLVLWQQKKSESKSQTLENTVTFQVALRYYF